MCPDAFQTTQWSLLLSARDDSVDVAREVFDGLARIYWKPLYVYVRRHSLEESEDLVQGFFARFIEKDYLTAVSADKGRFRAFLLYKRNDNGISADDYLRGTALLVRTQFRYLLQ